MTGREPIGAKDCRDGPPALATELSLNMQE